MDQLDTVESIKIRLAKKDLTISDEQEIITAWNPGWNPRQAILDFVVPTFKFVNGKFIQMDKIFSEPEIWDFPDIGRQLVAHHSHKEPFSLPHTFAAKGLKYCDFKYYVGKSIGPLIAIGLGQEEPIDVNGNQVSPLEVLLKFVPHPGDAFLAEDPKTFEYLDKTKRVTIQNEIVGTKNGKKIKYIITVFDINAPRQLMYDLYGTSMIAVALPAAIAAKMAIIGTKKGVIQPQDMDPCKFFELLEKSGHPNSWEEEIIEI